MESQVTLVDSPLEENITIVFDSSDVTNTTLRTRCGRDYVPRYSVHTLGNETTVHAGDHLLATVTRRTFRRDQITFPGLEPMHLGRWLKSPILLPFPLVFHAGDQQFEWKINTSEQLVLCASDRPNDIVARFTKSRRGDLIQSAYLTIKPWLDWMTDMIVLTCILAEHKLTQVISSGGRKAAYIEVVVF